MPGRATWDLDRFAGGIDLRGGIFSQNQSRFRELDNLWIDKGGKLRRRPPCLEMDGDLDALSQGLVLIDGQYFTFAQKGVTIAHTGDVALQVQTLYFDVPDLCTSTWELLSVGVFNGHAACWIRHTFPSTAYPSLCFLHAWDGLVYAPTFVQDPYLPGSFSPSLGELAGQRYESTFSPVLGQGASKLWTDDIDGDASCCGTADARVWNQRTKDSFLEDGEYWCYVVPEGLLTTRSYIVPRDASWMAIDGRWAYYVLEYASGSTWVPMTEVAIAPVVAYTWRPVSIASRFTGGWNEIRIDVCWGAAAAGLIRLRMVSGSTSVDVTLTPTVTVAYAAGTWKLHSTVANYRYRSGDGATVAAFDTAAIAPGKTYLLGVTPDEANFPALWNVTDNGFPNGWQREHRHFHKRVVMAASQTGTTAVSATLGGAYAAFAAGDTTVSIANTVGTVVGNNLLINGHNYTVTSVVVGATQLCVIQENGASGDFTAIVNGLYAVVVTQIPVITDYQYAYELNADSAWYTARVIEYIDLAGAEDALTLASSSHDNTGGRITAISAIKTRMLIAYEGSLQLWSIDEATNRTAFLDTLSFGTGVQASPSPVTWYGAIAIPMVTGFRAISVVGPNTDNLQDLNIGEPIADLEMLSVRSASFWPWYGQLIIAGKRGSDLVFLCLDYSRESKITAWSQWTVTDVADVDVGTLIPDQGKLRFRVGTKIRYFDAEATLFRDAGEVAGAAYESVALFHFNDMGKPGQNKRFVALDVAQDGSCSVGFQLPPYGSWGSEAAGPSLDGPTIEGITYGKARYPLAMFGPAIAPRLTTRCETGWRLQRIAIDFLAVRR